MIIKQASRDEECENQGESVLLFFNLQEQQISWILFLPKFSFHIIKKLCKNYDQRLSFFISF